MDEDKVRARANEIKADHIEYLSDYVRTREINTAEQLGNRSDILRLGFAYEITQYLVDRLYYDYDVDTEKSNQIVETPHIFNKIMDWYESQEYSPNITSRTAIDDWINDCLDEIKRRSAVSEL